MMASKTKKRLNLNKNTVFMEEMNIEYVSMNGGTQFNLVIADGRTVAFYPTTNKWVCDGKTYYGDAEKMWDWVGMSEEAG
jgi:hypothetical protein